MAYGLTKRQHEALIFIETFASERGYAPSFQEIMEALGLHSKSGVHRIVLGLRERGLVSMLDNRKRSISVHPTAMDSLRGYGL